MDSSPKNSTPSPKQNINPNDNLSISEIIAMRYKKKVHKIRSPQEAAKLMIKDTTEFDVNSVDYTEGSQQE